MVIPGVEINYADHWCGEEIEGPCQDLQMISFTIAALAPAPPPCPPHCLGNCGCSRKCGEKHGNENEVMTGEKQKQDL